MSVRWAIDTVSNCHPISAMVWKRDIETWKSSELSCECVEACFGINSGLSYISHQSCLIEIW